MDHDKSPPPTPRDRSSLDNTQFTSPPFMSTLPLPHPMTRPVSDSRLHTRKMSPDTKKLYQSSPRPRHRTHSADSSIASDSSSPSMDSERDNGKNESSFNLGDYTIDIAKLGQSSADGKDLFATVGESNVETPVRARASVRSDDDGPQDFTINMGQWMKGVGAWSKEPEMERQQIMRGAEDGLVVEADDGGKRKRSASVEDAPEEENDCGSVIVTRPASPADHRADAARGESTTPPMTPLNKHCSPDKVGEQESTTVCALRAEVEYLHLEVDAYRKEADDIDLERAQLESEKNTLAVELRTTKLSLERLQEENAAHRQQLEIETKKQEANVSNVGNLRSKFEPLAQELIAVRREAEAAKEDARTKIASMNEQLSSIKDELAKSQEVGRQYPTALAELNNTRLELNTLRQDLLNQKMVFTKQEEACSSQNEELRAHLAVASETNLDARILRTELERAQIQLTETRRILETAEDENDHFMQRDERQVQEIDNMRKELSDTKDAFGRYEQEIQEKAALMAKLEDELKTISLVQQTAQPSPDNVITDQPTWKSPVIGMAEADMRLADQLDNLSAHYEAELANLKKTHQEETKKLKTTLLRAAEGMRKKEARAMASHAAEVKQLRAEIERLEKHQADEDASKAEAAESGMETTGRTTEEAVNTRELRDAIRILSFKLKETQSELAKAREGVRELKREREERERAREEREEDQEAVNKALEERFSQAFEKREKEWRRRIGVVLRDRDMMGKTLMWTWGKEEVGERRDKADVGGEGLRDKVRSVGKGMGYRYRFVQRGMKRPLL